MKRIIYFVAVLTFIFAFTCSMVAFADEVETVPEATTETTESSPETTPPVESVTEAPEAPKPTIFTRLYEAFTSNKTEVFTLGSGAVLFILGLLSRKDAGVTARKLIDNIANVLSKTDLSNEQQSAIVNGLNEMVDGYNDIKSRSAAMESELRDFAFIMGNLAKSNDNLQTKLDHVFDVIVTLMDKEIMQELQLQSAGALQQ